VNSALLDRAATLARSFAAICLLLAPGLALSYWLFPRRALDTLERAYLGALSSLSLLTLFGVALLEGRDGLNPWLLATCALACTAACVAGAVARVRRRHARGSRPKPDGVVRGMAIWVHGTRSCIPAPFVTRIYPAPARARKRHRRTGRRVPAQSIQRPVRAIESPLHLSRSTRSTLGLVSLLVTAILTLLIYRIFALRPLPGGPVVAFSIPADRLVDAQAALLQGGRLAIPFQVENLSANDAAYRVEAWAATAPGSVGIVTVESLDVPTGATRCGYLQVELLPGAENAAVDLYLFPAEAAVPLAHLRLWSLDTSSYPR
jgi:uncharacterized membrane protein